MRRKSKISRPESITAADRISECPDSVLVHILSFLDIKDAVRTQVLSKRWQFLWTFLPSLVFRAPRDDTNGHSYDFNVKRNDDVVSIIWNGYDFSVRRNDDFVSFIDKTLYSSDCRLKKLLVDLEYHASFASKVDSWTRFAVEKGVEELCLELLEWKNGTKYELPQLLYDNSMFKELHFAGCRVIPQGNVAWSSLKKLSIGYVKCSYDVIERILAGSPVLEILELYFFMGFNRINITNSCVKKLILKDFLYSTTDRGLEITAPHILSLEMSGCLGYFCRLTNVSSLVDAIFNCKFCYSFEYGDDGRERAPNIVQNFLASLSHVKNLTLGTWALQVLLIMESKRLSSPLMNCKCLTVYAKFDWYVLWGISNVFKSTPNLEALIMTYAINQSEIPGIAWTPLLNYNEEQSWTSLRWTFKCLTHHLKIVRMNGCLMRGCDSSFLSFVQFLLRNARVLQKMVISRPSYAQSNDNLILAIKLLSFPRSSPDAAVMFL